MFLNTGLLYVVLGHFLSRRGNQTRLGANNTESYVTSLVCFRAVTFSDLKNIVFTVRHPREAVIFAVHGAELGYSVPSSLG